jgi:hypothetical protein
MPPTNGVIDFFLHPTFAQLTTSTTSPSLMPSPLSGTNVLNASVGIASSFGMFWTVTLQPPFAGKRLGVIDEFEDLVFDLVVEHTLVGGLTVPTMRFQSSDTHGIVLWSNLLPTQVTVKVFPGFELGAAWIIGI